LSEKFIKSIKFFALPRMTNWIFGTVSGDFCLNYDEVFFVIQYHIFNIFLLNS